MARLRMKRALVGSKNCRSRAIPKKNSHAVDQPEDKAEERGGFFFDIVLLQKYCSLQQPSGMFSKVLFILSSVVSSATEPETSTRALFHLTPNTQSTFPHSTRGVQAPYVLSRSQKSRWWVITASVIMHLWGVISHRR